MTRSVVAQFWTGSTVLRTLGPNDPTPTAEQLDALAGDLVSDGIRPVIRVVEESGLPGGGRGAAGGRTP